jgi:hypothetical protein
MNPVRSRVGQLLILLADSGQPTLLHCSSSARRPSAATAEYYLSITHVGNGQPIRLAYRQPDAGNSLIDG